MGNVIPDGDYIVMDKMDGSLGILYWHDGQPYISTRGSFTSDQAKWATDWIRKPENFELIRALDKKQTHLFEIIYPENRIVLAYDFSGLVYLGNRDIETGQYNPPESSLGFRVPERLNPYLTIDYIKSLDTKNKEGVVLYYPAIQMWLKVKFDTYVKLHKVMTGLSERGIWELLQSKGINSTCRDLVQDVPDEFYSWMELILEKMKSEYMNIEETAQWQFGKIEDMAEGYGTAIRNEETGEIEVGEHEVPPRSWWAQEIKKMEVPALGFAMLDKKDYAPFVFKMIKPTHHKTFRNETDL